MQAKGIDLSKCRSSISLEDVQDAVDSSGVPASSEPIEDNQQHSDDECESKLDSKEQDIGEGKFILLFGIISVEIVLYLLESRAGSLLPIVVDVVDGAIHHQLYRGVGILELLYNQLERRCNVLEIVVVFIFKDFSEDFLVHCPVDRLLVLQDLTEACCFDSDLREVLVVDAWKCNSNIPVELDISVPKQQVVHLYLLVAKQL